MDRQATILGPEQMFDRLANLGGAFSHLLACGLAVEVASSGFLDCPPVTTCRLFRMPSSSRSP